VTATGADLGRRLGRELRDLDPRAAWRMSPRQWAAANPGFVVFGGAILGAELLTAFGFGVAAVAVNGLVLVGLVVLAALVEDEPILGSLIALAMVAIERIISIAAPLPFGGEMLPIATTGACILLGVAMAAPRLGLSRQALGLRAGNPRALLLVGLAGIPLGLLGALLFGSFPAVEPGALAFVGSVVTLFLFAALVEELVFRGLFPAVVVRAGGDERTGILAGTAFWIAALLPTLSAPYIALMIPTGIWFAAVRLKTGSVLGTTLARGVMLVIMVTLPAAVAG